MSREPTILLTGATGLLGQFLLVDLLRSRCPVAVLARGSRTGSAQDRVEQILTRFEESAKRRFPRPVILEGDLTRSGLGLNPGDLRWLANHCGSVIHSAASLSFKPAADHPDNEPFRTNVEGTRELLKVCRDAGIEEFHDISSAYVCGLREGRISERDGDFGQSFSNDYEQSKLTAEQLVHNAGFKSVTVYRPSIVVDPTPGSLQLGDRTIYYAFNVFRLMTQRFGEFDIDQLFPPIGLTGQERKNIVDAGWVARTIVEIFRRPQLHGTTYHLTNPRGTPLRDLLSAFQDVLQPRRVGSGPQPHPNNGWGDLTGIVEQFIETFTPYFRDDPEFDQTHLKHALSVCKTSSRGITNCPEVEKTTLEAIARQQMTSRPPLAVSSTAELSHWHRWVELQTSSQEQNLLDNALQNRIPLSRLCLSLTGIHGGTWTCSWKTDFHSGMSELCIETGQVDVAGDSAYLLADLWEEILAGRKEIEQAVRTGEILIEAPEISICGANIAKLVKIVQSQLKETGAFSEVSTEV
ncbi:MAG TPA: SDR family oxidoreductase [Planctomicrobium sp.]|nr:SDR family oxidoreductase [Planctomicrobium sp.]